LAAGNLQFRFDAEQNLGKITNGVSVALVGMKSSSSSGSIQSIIGFGSIVELKSGIVTVKCSGNQLKSLRNERIESVNMLVSSECFNYCPGVMRKAVLNSVKLYLNQEITVHMNALTRFLRRIPLKDEEFYRKTSFEKDKSRLDVIIERVKRMKGEVLVIQGPAGTGKTRSSAGLIESLVNSGKTVAVCTNSHDGIDNLLIRVAELGVENVTKIGKSSGLMKENEKHTKKNGKIPIETQLAKVKVGTNVEQGQISVVGATVYQLSRVEACELFDYLIIDEAGQVSVANLVAMGLCATNYVLVGDQNQLGMPVKAQHNGNASLSCLEYFLGLNCSTVPKQYGEFLETTYRLPPSICTFLSSSVYQNRLVSHETTLEHRMYIQNKKNQSVNDTVSQLELELAWKTINMFPKGHAIHGLVYIPTEDSTQFEPLTMNDNEQRSMIEAVQICGIFSWLIGSEYVLSKHEMKTLQVDDIMVVTPYNQQVNLLQSMLPIGSRVGTVDRFQGQESPVVIVSLCGKELNTSEEDTESNELDSFHGTNSRGLRFVLDRNRLNVALSRAQCVAIVVANKELSHTRVKSLSDLNLINLFCKIMQESPTHVHEIIEQNQQSRET